MRLFDTYTKSLVELPAPPAPIRMYFCGPTVYARAHVGNARPFVIGMWLRAWLRARGYDATLVHNITDVNDKIYDAAPGASAELAERATAWYLEDTADLGLGMPDHLPKVTEHIPGIIRFIEQLIERDYAYVVEGDVYFRVARFPDYGRLSGQRPDQVEEQEPNPLKEDGRDFALWKANKPGEDTSWEAPWGRGRPGWHIECSAMAEELLGDAFEIHGGGLDLVFPHHENELAQSRALGHPFAQIWAHNGLLQFTGEKMSKSVGNIATLRETLDLWGREALLMFFLTAHWRKPTDFSPQTIADASARVARFRNAFMTPDEVSNYAQMMSEPWEAFERALEDDFNTPQALAVMHGWSAARQLDDLGRALAIFGLQSLKDPAVRDEAPPEIAKLAELRNANRALGEYAAADRLREEIEAAGWEMRDEPNGYTLVRRS
jgi:cysteinyl-tRNA synthetase